MFLHNFMHPYTWSPICGTVWGGYRPSGGVILLEKVSHLGGLWRFIAPSSYLFILSVPCVWIKCYQPASCSILAAMPWLLCHNGIFIILEPWTETTSFLLKLLLVTEFYQSNKSITVTIHNDCEFFERKHSLESFTK